jgi:hypothetical protein
MGRVRLIPHHLQLHTRTMRGRVASLTWKLPDDLSEDEWIEAGIVLASIGAGVMWWVGDYWIYGENNYGDRKAIVDDPIGRGHPSRHAPMLLRFVEHSKLPVGGKF